MMKAILGRDIRIGDIILVGGGIQGKVLRHLFNDSGGLHFELDIGHLSFLSEGVIGLVHRPYPEGKTEQDVLKDIDAAIADAWLGRVSTEAGRGVLRYLLDVYELGKPLAAAKEDEQVRSEADVSSGYLGGRCV